MPISLYPHNAAAYEAAVSMLHDTGKAAVIHPTGTGKSFIAFKLCEDNPDKRICWLSPSEYIYRTQLENLQKTISPSPCACPSLNFELSTLNFQNILFLTYARLMLMDEAEIAEIKPDYIILDEFHRCGAEQWGRGVRNLRNAYPSARILGLTATNIRYLDQQRDMADELFDSNIASWMTLGEAIVRGVLNPPRYILSVFSYHKDLEKYRRKIASARSPASRQAAEEVFEALRRELANADGLDEVFRRHMTDRHGKYLVFCSNAGHMDDMMRKAPEWFAKVDPAPHIYRVYSEDPGTEQAFSDFKADASDHLKLLYCIDMLNEGVHVSDVSGVILLRPTVSPIVFKQQIGRALSAAPLPSPSGGDALSKRAGVHVCNQSGEQAVISTGSSAPVRTSGADEVAPVIFDIVLNIESLYSIGTVQDEMQAAITYYRYLGQYENIINEHFSVIDETGDCRRLFAELERRLNCSWDLMLQEAKKYYLAHGDLLVPARYRTESGLSLGNWLNVQRRIYNGRADGFLTDEQIAQLNALGIVWDSYLDRSWEKNYLEAKAYYEKFGDLLVPIKYVTESGFPLGIWIMRMRQAYSCRRSGVLTAEREKKLNEIHMSWDALCDQWERNYLEAASYYREHGNLLVPGRYVSPSGLKLGNWIAHLRQNRSKGTLTPEQIDRLDRIGMAWDADEERWRLGYEAALLYSRRHGHLNVPAKYETADGYRLGLWIQLKRRQYKKGSLTPDQVRSLEAIGMSWEVHSEHWQQMYDEARAWYEANGNLQVPRGVQTADGYNLNLWLGRMKREKESLSPAQISALTAIGMSWPAQIAIGR